MTNTRALLDDCFLHDKDRMKHAEVLETIAANVTLIVGDETISLYEAAGRVVAQDVFAPRNVPLTDNAAVDGYAFSHKDYIKHAGTLTLGALIAAGQPHHVTLKSGECARIFTGAVMPQNADSVAMQEDCSITQDGQIFVPSGLKQGANCRRAGEDLTKGAPVVEKGEILSAGHIAALASIGQAIVLVRKKLRVAILSTGNEIIEPGQSITQSQVYDANRAMVMALLPEKLTSITDGGILPDTQAALTEKLSALAKNHDLIFTSGSASRGDEDHALNALGQLGKRHLWQIAIKPGRPMMFGQIGNCAIIGLPGNPAASMVCTLLYGLPLIAGLTGAKLRAPIAMNVPANFKIKSKKTDRREFLRGWLESDENGELRAQKFERDGSGLITGLRKATGLIELPENISNVKIGDIVRFIPFSAFNLE